MDHNWEGPFCRGKTSAERTFELRPREKACPPPPRQPPEELEEGWFRQRMYTHPGVESLEASGREAMEREVALRRMIQEEFTGGRS